MGSFWKVRKRRTWKTQKKKQVSPMQRRPGRVELHILICVIDRSWDSLVSAVPRSASLGRPSSQSLVCMVLGVLMTTVDSLTFEGGTLPETLLFRGVFGSVES